MPLQTSSSASQQEMAPQCKKCTNNIKDRYYLHCMECLERYHLDCTNVTYNHYTLMTMEHKKTWKCDLCWTTRNKKVNSLEKSFDNINTKRRRFTREYNISADSSLDKFSGTLSENEDLSFSSLTSEKRLNRSCPETRSAMNEYSKELEKKIQELENKLQISETEIDNLNSENNKLNKTITDLQIKINQLTHICSSNVKKTRKKSFNRTRLDFTQIESPSELDSNPNMTNNLATSSDEKEHQNTTQQHQTRDRVDSNSNPNMATHLATSSDGKENQQTSQIQDALTEMITPIHTDGAVHKNKNITNTKLNINSYQNDQITSQQQTEKNMLHRIHIFADEQGRGICKQLQKTLGCNYKVFSDFKPGATTDKVLEYMKSTCYDYGKNDYILIMTGKNDKDPLRTNSYLYYYLSQLQNTNIILCEPQENIYINTEQINKTYRLLSSRLSHVNYVDLHYSYPEKKKYNSKHFCQNILQEILRLEYYYKLINRHTEIIQNINKRNDNQYNIRKQQTHILNETFFRE